MYNNISWFLHFPNDKWCSASFYVLICHLNIFSAELFGQIFFHYLLLWIISYQVFRVLYIFNHKSLITYKYWNYFLSVHVLSLYSHNSIFWSAKVYNFDEVQFHIFFYYGLWFCCYIYKKYLFNSRFQRFFPLCFF